MTDKNDLPKKPELTESQSIVEWLFSKARQLATSKEEVLVKASNKKEHVLKPAYQINEIAHLQHLAVEQIIGIQKETVDLVKKQNQKKLEIIESVKAQTRKIRGFESDEDLKERFRWVSYDHLKIVEGSQSQYTVANEEFAMAEFEFMQMLKSNNVNTKDPFVSSTIESLRKNRTGNLDLDSIQTLIKKDFAYREWQGIKARLQRSWDKHYRKTAIKCFERETLRHEAELITFRSN